MSTATQRYIISQLENLKEEVAVIKKLVLSLTEQTTATDLPKGVELPLTNIVELKNLESKLKEEGCYSAMVHLIVLNTKHLFCNLLLIKESAK